MFVRFSVVLVAAAICLGAARAQYEVPAEEDLAYRLPRSIQQHSFPRPGSRPQPSPTFPRLPKSHRFRREAEVDEESVIRHVRSLQPYNPRFPSPVPLPGAPPRPYPTHRRFKRGGGSVSVDVNKDRGSRHTARVNYEQNLYKSGNGRTRVDANAYATNRGDRGGMINFSHRFR